MRVDLDVLVGKSTKHLVDWDEAKLNQEVAQDFTSLCVAARADQIEIQIVSGFRSFEAQCGIWNAKANGQRKLLDKQGQLLKELPQDKTDLVLTILRWSALPGASRHHWGTDLDVCDSRAMPSDYEVQLMPEEYTSGGIFNNLSLWLDENMKEYGFFRPYSRDLGGVAVEPWHISHRRTAERYLRSFSLDMFLNFLDRAHFSLSQEAREIGERIYNEFIVNINYD